MTQITGADAVVAMYDQTDAKADPGTPNGFLLHYVSVNIDDSRDQLDDPTISGGRGTARPRQGNFKNSGNIDGVISPEGIGRFLKHIIGEPTETGAGPYSLAFKPTTLPAGFIVEVDWTSTAINKVRKARGCRFMSAQFTFPQNDFAKFSAPFAFLSYFPEESAPLDATLTDNGHNGLIGPDAIFKVEGSQVGGVKDFSISIDNGIDDGIYCYPDSGETAGERNSLPAGKVKISGSFEAILEDDTISGYAQNRTDVQLEIVHTIGDGGGTAGNEKISWLIDHCDIFSTGEDIQTPSGLSKNYNFQAWYDPSSSDMGLLVTLDTPLQASEI